MKKIEISKEQLIELQDSGHTKEEIAEILGVSYRTVENKQRKYGLIKPKNVLQPEIREKIIEMHQSGKSVGSIAKNTGYRYHTVYHMLRAAGLLNVRGYAMQAAQKADVHSTEPKALQYAQKRRPKITVLVAGGRTYDDVTDYYVPY